MREKGLTIIHDHWPSPWRVMAAAMVSSERINKTVSLLSRALLTCAECNEGFQGHRSSVVDFEALPGGTFRLVLQETYYADGLAQPDGQNVSSFTILKCLAYMPCQTYAAVSGL